VRVEVGVEMRGSVRGVFLFGATSLVAIAAGCVAMARSDLSPSTWSRNIVAWVVGAALCALLARFGRGRAASITAVVVGISALFATLFAPAVDGVHRWLDIGPLHLNAAALFVPALIVALAALGHEKRIALPALAIVAALFVAQPDTSQCSAVALAGSILVLRAHIAPQWKVITIAGALLSVIVACARRDPLQPVPEVEQIFRLCAAVSPLLAIIAALSLGAAALSPLAFASPARNRARDGALALSAYFVAVSIAPLIRSFPVPLVGLGMSFPLGWWLAIGLLLATTSHRSVRPDNDHGSLSA
jgi:cell division protein FtsW (lipid II flippase)